VKTLLIVIVAAFIFAQYENLVVDPRKEKARQTEKLQSDLGQISWTFNIDSIRQVFKASPDVPIK